MDFAHAKTMPMIMIMRIIRKISGANVHGLFSARMFTFCSRRDFERTKREQKVKGILRIIRNKRPKKMGGAARSRGLPRPKLGRIKENRAGNFPARGLGEVSRFA